MICGIDNGQMVTDLDANHFRILNLSSVIGPPPNDLPDGLVGTDDPRLSDARAPLDGSVTDASVAFLAGIVQSKLNLNGTIPPLWLGTDATHAANGSLVEYMANKGQPGGYAALDGTGKVPIGQLPNDIGTGTVTSVGLVMPADFSVAGTPVTTTGTITVTWASVPNGTWFGNATGGSAVPSFQTTPITTSMVPPLPASKIVTGTIDMARLPIAIGVGSSSSSGLVPDPGPTGNATDYLARDMTYKPVPSIGPSYQPVADSPVIVPLNAGSDVVVGISSPLTGASLFYNINGADYAPAPSGMTVHVLTGETINVYAAKAGYTNSDVAAYTNT
jgi:hypothetical protein